MSEWQPKIPILGWPGSGPAKSIVIGSQALATKGKELGVYSPVDGQVLTAIRIAKAKDLDPVIQQAHDAFRQWRNIPAPQRGQLVRVIGDWVRRWKEPLAEFITVEAGKTYQEALGEVQEWIDICDFAVGLSRQLYGLTIATERPDHRMMEQWHPLGPVGVITAFNFPMAVWAWNAMIGLVCGDTFIWKPSEKTPLCALACQTVVARALESFPEWQSFSQGLSSVVVGDREVGHELASNPRLPLISATGSVTMGRKVGAVVAERLGKTLLELGGNNGLIVAPSARMDLAIRAIVFAAVGTTGQRCTSLRRLIVHSSMIDQVQEQLVAAYRQLKIGNPFDHAVHIGPLIDQHSFDAMQAALNRVNAEGGQLVYGGEEITQGLPSGGVYVTPALVRMPGNTEVVKEETFAPILYLIPYDDFAAAIELHNDVPQGLSSALFTQDMAEAERFLSASGSDCGIANINIGTSGAEIGGAFGGEKDTGGGRESGSDAWKNYMRRSTNTINYGDALPLAQGIEFDF